MSQTEVKEHADDLARRREGGETIGKKRKTQVAKRKVAESMDEGDKANAGPSKRAKKAGEQKAVQKQQKTAKKSTAAIAAQMPPRSVSIINDSTDDEGVVCSGLPPATAPA